ncbi:phage tail protein [Sphingosinicella sp. BN140058]|uniref:phage tail protein n=1 Tax=Sphingosinicella sp. BN140058 TaxID=1892855 RepID=UPI0010108CC4|nr:tail fiber protein [Sphingosinicella sp. BN140058]QAY77377.1 phage tail protein [Sphingosinicella sp. BN140058]
MAQPYVGEIRMFGGNFPPSGWLFCNGQVLPISENEALFQLIGTTYGGDGESTFALPNLQSRIPIHFGNGPSGIAYQIAEAAGVETVTLTTQQMPSHTHPMSSTTTSQTLTPQGAKFADITSTTAGVTAYAPATANVALLPQLVGPAGGSQPHDNVQPYLCINYIISLFGIFPSPT